ncbi:helix-turn-helix transcriptional regulator [Geitlerinema splendidum]|nr:helix-turn-helix transcriptional regulator [Geitlerinema splendidum]
MHHSHLIALNYNRAINERISALNEPLMKTCGLSLLTFRRFSNTGELLYIFNNNSWMEYSFENTYWNSMTFGSRVNQLSKQKFLNYIWPDFPDSQDPIYCALYGHNIWNGIIMYRKYDDCIEAFAFVAGRENAIIKNFYADSINILNDYIVYFKDKAHDLIHPNDKNIFIPYNLDISGNSTILENNIKNFFEQTKVSKLFLTINGKDVPMSKREIECLFHVSKGKSMKEIALLLNLSPRTVESHLNSSKIKAGSTVSNLIEAFLKSKFIIHNYHKLMGEKNEN